MTGKATGEYSRQMTAEEIAGLDALWARMHRTASYQEILELIAAGQIR
jgi:hypothetical protein